MDDFARAAMGRIVPRNPFMRGFQQLKLAVNVADGIEPHGTP